MTNKIGILNIERRTFLKKTGTLSVMSLFGISFVTSCTDESESLPNTNDNGNAVTVVTDEIIVTDKQVIIDLNKTTTLKTSGAWLLITSAQMLIVNVNNEFYSLTSICTHSGCDRNWSLNNNQFICGCHDSRFTTQGEVIKGPANAPLRIFNNSLTGNTLTIVRS